jgi:ubiquinone/menaquinone biosynthesis C-methylase UbiE
MRTTTQVYETVFDAVVVNTRTRLLDVACGSGEALVCAARRGAELAGVDASEELIRIARDRLPNADLRLGTVFELPFADGSFDVVTSFDGIWMDDAAALQEINRVVAPGGRLGFAIRTQSHCQFVIADA